MCNTGFVESSDHGCCSCGAASEEGSAGSYVVTAVWVSLTLSATYVMCTIVEVSNGDITSADGDIGAAYSCFEELAVVVPCDKTVT